MSDLHYLLASAGLAWMQLMTASLIRARAWTPEGMVIGFGNRDDVPKESPLGGRADRAAKNMLENLVLFAVVLLAARGLGAQASRLVLGCQLFFFSRVVYFGIYLAGVKYLRTAVWLVSVVGIALVALAAFR